MFLRRLIPTVVAAASLAALAPAARAADTYEINTILPLSGSIAFVGSTQLQALKAVEAYVNRTGGIRGRPISFVVADDQSDPKTALLLAQRLIAKNVPVILGPSSPQSCAAIAPLIAQDGPVHYCLANSGHPPTGGYEFLTLFSYESLFAVTLRYVRERGLRQIAYIVSTDAGGQDAERALLAAAELRENKGIQIVARQYFAPGDISAAAQMARIKAANPDVLVAWSTGTPAGTLFRSAHDAGLDVPTITSPGNLNAAFFRQYGSLLPTNLYFAAVPYYAGDVLNNRATKTAIATLTDSLAAVGAKPDMIEISAWDPALLLVDALRKLGPDTSAAKLRAYLVNLNGWVGVNGPFDFRASPQRGLGVNNIVMVRWDTQRNAGVAVSKLGGAPLR
ncbi:MAG TPA: ABC transporter substrate-binding protein [Candidatus Binatia bacterium]|nr:ABC transporter substrate-binding protein [Candidatus Binatia bacterium]